jgi:hypothetical protein
MRIRPEQYSEFARRSREDYVQRMMSHLRTLYPEFYHRRETTACREFIEESVGRALAYGLQDESTVTRYLDYRVLLGPEFESIDDNAWMVRILKNSDRDESDRIADIDRIQFGIGAAH